MRYPHIMQHVWYIAADGVDAQIQLVDQPCSEVILASRGRVS